MRYDIGEGMRRAERMQILTDGDFDRYFALLEEVTAERTRVAAEILGMMGAHGCVAIVPCEGVLAGDRLYLHPAPDGRLHLTHFDDLGAVGHVVVDDMATLERELPHEVFEVTTYEGEVA